ncbi:MAG: sulfatase [Planctomycetota bacterium]
MKPALTLLCALAVLSCGHSPAAETAKPNILFLVSDDLNCHIGCYGDPVAKTPNLDRLASWGVRFDRAYCQQPLCNPTRASLLSGLYPTTTGVLDNNTWLVLDAGRKILPRYFESQGYATVELGKIWHGPNDTTPKKRERTARAAAERKGPVWFTPAERAEQQRTQPDYWYKVHSPYRNNALKPAESYAWANLFGPLEDMKSDDLRHGTYDADTRIADEAIASLERLTQDRTKPFFLSVGFIRPHVPLIAPKKYFDLYQAGELPLPPDFANEPTLPPNSPEDEKRQNIDLYAGRSFTAAEARAALRAYYASVSYMDAELGRVLNTLENSGQRNNTLIVFWGDHGWHLSDKGMWAKGTLFEASARGPLLIVDPRKKATAGRVSRRVVEYLDIFPTLVDLSGVEQPMWLEGTSLKPLLLDPDAAWDRPAYTVQPRHWFIGRSIRTERWRYTEWDEGRRGTALYDHDTDPHELRNLAHDPAHVETVAQLQKQLRESKVGQSMRHEP